MLWNKKLILFIGLVLLVLIDLFVILPSQLSQSRNIYKDVVRIREELSMLDKDLKNKQKLVDEKEAVEIKLRNLQTKFLSKDDSTLIMSQINRISKKLNIDIKNIKPQGLREISREKDTIFSYLPFNVILDTTYHRFGQFLNKLEELDYFLIVKELKIKGEFPKTQINVVICGIVKE